MTFDEREKALTWLSENTDKWDNWCGFHWLVPNPEEVAPKEVFIYLQWEEENEKSLDEIGNLMDAMGFNNARNVRK